MRRAPRRWRVAAALFHAAWLAPLVTVALIGSGAAPHSSALLLGALLLSIALPVAALVVSRV